jgi:wyosine [tRNA(Phe)-imidazoG37] synthetase (radical SAM superfamily)
MGKQKSKTHIHIYGPVPSRRLGFSLGVDIIPYKTCSLDCIYCQLGSTAEKSVECKAYFDKGDLLFQIKQVVNSGRRIDYITFSGSGEPTLNILIGELIREIKKFTSISVAVLTNGTMLTKPDVRAALSQADLVVPSLDAVTQAVFEEINRPHESLKISEIIDGLISFRKEFAGQIWLEIMLVKGINDSEDHVKRLRQAVEKIQPDRVQLNTVVRPPAQDFAVPLSQDELGNICHIIGSRCEIVADFKKIHLEAADIHLEEVILEMTRRRPVTSFDIANSMGRHIDEVMKSIHRLQDEKKIRESRYENKVYYEAV